MPGLLNDSFQKIQVEELHPTYGAVLSGIDFTKPIDEDTFEEISTAAKKVSLLSRMKIWQMLIPSVWGLRV